MLIFPMLCIIRAGSIPSPRENKKAKMGASLDSYKSRIRADGWQSVTTRL